MSEKIVELNDANWESVVEKGEKPIVVLFSSPTCPYCKQMEPYLEENAQGTLEGLSPHAVWLPSVWPETYSYTLSIALQAGLPVAAFDIGAMARRIGECDPKAGHRILTLDFARRPAQLNDCFTDFRSSYLVSDTLRQAS